MTAELEAIKYEFNRLFSEHSEQSLRAVCSIAVSPEINALIRAEGEFAYFIESSFIYRNELSEALSENFYSDVHSVEEASSKVQKYKFLLWNLEFDADKEAALSAITADLTAGSLSSTALLSLIDVYSFNKTAVKEALSV